MNGYMKVTGVGTVKAVPDTAIVTLGVVTENTSLEAARSENAAKSTAVINALNRMGIPNRFISTSYYAIEPVYDYIDGKQTFKGYRVSNLLSVTVTDISKLGVIIDSATAAGANRVDNISFTLMNPEEYYDKALKLAVRNAMHKAFEIGSTLGVEVSDVPCKIIEERISSPVFESTALKLAAPATPILPGQMDITANIVAIIGYNG